MTEPLQSATLHYRKRGGVKSLHCKNFEHAVFSAGIFQQNNAIKAIWIETIEGNARNLFFVKDQRGQRKGK